MPVRCLLRASPSLVSKHFNYTTSSINGTEAINHITTLVFTFIYRPNLNNRLPRNYCYNFTPILDGWCLTLKTKKHFKFTILMVILVFSEVNRGNRKIKSFGFNNYFHFLII